MKKLRKRTRVMRPLTALMILLLLVVGCGGAVENTVVPEIEEVVVLDDAPPVEADSGWNSVFPSPSETNGDVLILYGQVLDVNAVPVPNAEVVIWQTDENGVYDHPRDPTTESRDMSFQFYGSDTSDAEGNYEFRTILPGEYEPRPRHIHFKVNLDGETVLTSQFYFSEDVADVQGEVMFREAGDQGDLLLLQLVQDDGFVTALGRIVVNNGDRRGELTLTPSQGEGPYYPVVTVEEFDNDLVVLP